jgi:hypothetical protein
MGGVDEPQPFSRDELDLLEEVVADQATGLLPLVRRLTKGGLLTNAETEELTDVLFAEWAGEDSKGSVERAHAIDGVIGLVYQHRRGFFD